MTTRQSPRTLPRVVWDDEWQAPPDLTKPRLSVKGVIIAISLLGAGAAVLKSSMADPKPKTAWDPTTTRQTASRTAAPSTQVLSRPTTSRDQLWEPNEGEVTEWSQPARRPVAQPRPPAARAAAAPGGFLSVNSTPWAELSVDGRLVGSTPQIRIRVPPGRHRLLLVREGFQPHTAWVDVVAGATVRVTGIALKASGQ